MKLAIAAQATVVEIDRVSYIVVEISKECAKKLLRIIKLSRELQNS